MLEKEGTISYSTSSPLSGGITSYWNPPINIKRFLDPKFVRLFIFDGELVQELLDPNKSEASQAIDSLFQLYLLDELHDYSENHWERKNDEKEKKYPKASKAKSEKGLNKKRTKVEELKKCIQTREENRKNRWDEYYNLEEEIKDLESKI